jgi:hypothetical protein
MRVGEHPPTPSLELRVIPPGEKAGSPEPLDLRGSCKDPAGNGWGNHSCAILYVRDFVFPQTINMFYIITKLLTAWQGDHPVASPVTLVRGPCSRRRAGRSARRRADRSGG